MLSNLCFCNMTTTGKADMMYPVEQSQVLNPWSSCFCLQHAGISSLCHQVQLWSLYYRLWIPGHIRLGALVAFCPGCLLRHVQCKQVLCGIERQAEEHTQNLHPPTHIFKSNNRNHIWYLTSIFLTVLSAQLPEQVKIVLVGHLSLM